MSTDEDDDTETVGPAEEASERPMESQPEDTGDAEDERWTAEGGQELPEEFQNLLERLEDSATARAVFGEPIERTGRTVVPVARVGFGFGGGSGTEPGEAGESGGGGMGMGGGLMARPAGALEVTDTDTRFVRIGGRRRTAMAAFLAFVAGWLLARALGSSDRE